MASAQQQALMSISSSNPLQPLAHDPSPNVYSYSQNHQPNFSSSDDESPLYVDPDDADGWRTVEDADSAEASWTSLPVNLADTKDDMDMPAEGVYEPTPAWERPAGHAVQGIDTFKVQCHINCFKEPVTPVVGDPGKAPTLISKGFLDCLQFSKPKPCTGQKLKLLQLTGSAGCSEYVLQG